MTITTTESEPRTRRSKAALTTARTVAGLLGLVQLTGAVYFIFVAPEESVWLGPWVDVPVVALLLAGVLLKLTVAVAPGLDHHRRIGLGLVAVTIGVAVTLLKIPLYDEPESAAFLVFDTVLVALLLLARRGASSR